MIPSLRGFGPSLLDSPALHLERSITMTSYDVICPSAAWENTTISDLDQVSDLCVNLSQDHGYVQVRHNGVIIEEYVDGWARF